MTRGNLLDIAKCPRKKFFQFTASSMIMNYLVGDHWYLSNMKQGT